MAQLNTGHLTRRGGTALKKKPKISALLAVVCWSFVVRVVARGGASPHHPREGVRLPPLAKMILAVVCLFGLWFIGR
jgi:hypothetical protein